MGLESVSFDFLDVLPVGEIHQKWWVWTRYLPLWLKNLDRICFYIFLKTVSIYKYVPHANSGLWSPACTTFLGTSISPCLPTCELPKVGSESKPGPKRKMHLPSIPIFQLLYLSFRESICIPSLSSRVYFYCLICLPPTEADPNPVSLALRPQSLHRNATCWVFSCRKVQRTHRWTAWKIFWNDGDTELMKSDKNTNGCQKQQVFVVVVVVVAVVVVSVVSVVVCTPRLNCKNNLELNMFRIWRWIKRSPGRK